MNAGLSEQVDDVLKLNKGLRLIEKSEEKITFLGAIHFNASYPGKEIIKDSYLLKIIIRPKFPVDIPLVFELEEKIPWNVDRHLTKKGQICLGSPLRLLLVNAKNPTIQGFFELCIVPFLYANSYFEKHGVYPWGDLDHEFKGVIEDYLEIFNLSSKSQLIHALKILTTTNFKAKKMRCPCGCVKRFRQCSYSEHLLSIKTIANKSFFQSQLDEIFKK